MPESTMLKDKTDEFWQESALPKFMEFVKIPCISPAYDSTWNQGENPPLAMARKLAEDWINSLKSLNAQICCGAGDTKSPPVLLVHVPAYPASTSGNVLTYGHFDKQAATVKGWIDPSPDGPLMSLSGPFIPDVYKDHLFGRGTSDDGFAFFTVITALVAMRDCDIPCPTVNVIVDFDEESGSENLKSALKSADFCNAIGQPDLCIELDSSIGDYDRLWYGETARGTITGTLNVKMLSSAVHSGDGGGIIPDPVNIMRLLLDRIHDAATGEVIIPQFRVLVPAQHLAQAQAQAANLGSHLIGDFPWLPDAFPYLQDPLQLILNRTWRATLAISAQKGLPALDAANNVIVPEFSYQLSMRLPPSVEINAAQKVLKSVLEADPPFGATVSYTTGAQGLGWSGGPPRQPWFEEAINTVSLEVFDEPPAIYAEGGTITVLNLMTSLYPDTQILATGAAGPHNNEHGPNENLNLGYAKKLALALAKMMCATARQKK